MTNVPRLQGSRTIAGIVVASLVASSAASRADPFAAERACSYRVRLRDGAVVTSRTEPSSAFGRILVTDEVGRTRELPARSVDVAEQKSQWLRCSLWRSLDVPDIRGTRLPDWELHAPASWKSDPDDRVFVYLLAGPCGPCLNALEDVRKATATGREGKRVKLLLLIADNDEARTLPPLEARGFVEASDCHFASVGEESFNRMSTTLRRGTKVGVSLLTDTSGCVVHANIGTWIAAEVVTRSLAADERCH